MPQPPRRTPSSTRVGSQRRKGRGGGGSPATEVQSSSSRSSGNAMGAPDPQSHQQSISEREFQERQKGTEKAQRASATQSPGGSSDGFPADQEMTEALRSWRSRRENS